MEDNDREIMHDDDRKDWGIMTIRTMTISGVTRESIRRIWGET